MRDVRISRLLATTLIATLFQVGCGGGQGEPAGGSATVDIDGSSTVFRISEAAREGV